MGPSTTQTTSGGGAATPVANEFQSWLMTQLTGNGNAGGQFMGQQQRPLNSWLNPLGHGNGGGTYQNEGAGNGAAGGPNMTPQQRAAYERFINSNGVFQGTRNAPVNSSGMQPRMGNANPLPNSFNSSGSPFTNSFNNMLNGQIPDPSGANAAIASGIGSGASQYGQNYQNPYQNQQFQSAELSQIPTQFGQGQTGTADLSGVNQTALSSYTARGANSGFSDTISGLLGRGQSALGNTSIPQASAQQANIGPGIALEAATQFDMNNPYFNALKTQQERALTEATANNNARFGAAGAGAIGSGAQLANSNLQSAASADQTVALQQALQGLQQQDLSERGTRADVGLNSRGQDAQVGIANMNASLQAGLGNQQAMLQGMSQNNNFSNDLLQSALAGRGQDFNQQQSMDRMGLEQALQNSGFMNTRNGQQLQALLANQGLGNQFGLGAAELNNGARQMNNSNAMSQANSQNGFNLTNANQRANFQGQSNQLNSQNFQQNQQNFLNMLGMGQNTNQMANQNQAAALAQLFQSFGQSTGLGIEGRNTQTNQQGSPWGGILGAALPFIGQGIGALFNNRNNSNNPGGWNPPNQPRGWSPPNQAPPGWQTPNPQTIQYGGTGG